MLRPLFVSELMANGVVGNAPRSILGQAINDLEKVIVPFARRMAKGGRNICFRHPDGQLTIKRVSAGFRVIVTNDKANRRCVVPFTRKKNDIRPDHHAVSTLKSSFDRETNCTLHVRRSRERRQKKVQLKEE